MTGRVPNKLGAGDAELRRSVFVTQVSGAPDPDRYAH